MKRTLTACTAGLALMASLPFSGHAVPTQPNLSHLHYKARSADPFKSERQEKIDRINSLLYAGQDPAFAGDGDDLKPNFSFGPANNVSDIDGPDGQTWYYTAFYDYEIIPADYQQGIYYDEYILRSYRYDIYDENANPVGSISDKMRYQEGEVRTVYHDLTPFVSRNFFNTTGELEVAVGLVMNSEIPGNNQYRTLVYSLDGAKDSDGNDVPIASYPQLITDVAEAPKSADGRDNFYITFCTDFTADVSEGQGADGAEPDSFWDFLTRQHMNVQILGRAEEDRGPAVVYSQTIPLINLPGDQESSPFMFNFDHDGKLWFMLNYLEKPLWARYDSPYDPEMTQRPDNHLQIFLYEADGPTLTLRQKTLIPTPKDTEDEMAIASFYSVGDMRYKQDIVFDGFGQTDGKAAFYITRTNYTPSNDSSSQSYYAYDPDGNRIRTYAQYCSSTLSLSDLPGYEPQQMFVNQIGTDYLMTFIDLYSGKEVFSTSNAYYVNELDEPEYLLANLDRTIVGDSYQYAFEMRYPVEMDEMTMLRVLWVNADGSFDHIDYVNGGEDVLYGKFFISNEALQPGTFEKDSSEPAYLYMIKRGLPGNITGEDAGIGLPVSDENPEGKTLLEITPGEKGAIAGIVPFLIGEKKSLNVYFSLPDAKKEDLDFSLDIYELPLATLGIRDMAPETKGSLKVCGDLVSAKGEISVYNTAGALLMRGNSRQSLKGLPAGIYIVKAGGESMKIRR